jgi:hypothetical protein
VKVKGGDARNHDHLSESRRLVATYCRWCLAAGIIGMRLIRGATDRAFGRLAGGEVGCMVRNGENHA